MPFTGKATYDAGAGLPEIMEDVSDVIGIVSPHETALLDHLGDARRAALSTVHEWLEDSLLPNTDTIDEDDFDPDGNNATTFGVANPGRFRVGDQVRPGQTREVMLVTQVGVGTITVVRSYGGTPRATLADAMKLYILGNAALEGDARPEARFTNRVRKKNYTQIFTASVEVSGSMRASRLHGVRDEVDYQTQERVRELLRDLENCVINGVAAGTDPQGSDTVRRTMNGIIPQIATNQFVPGQGEIPPGGGQGADELNEAVLNAALRVVWEQSSARIDTIVVGGKQKRRINAFLTASRTFLPEDVRYRDLVSVYESDFGAARIVMSRWVPEDTVLLLDSSRIEVMPLAGRSFGYRAMAATGDAEAGLVVGEYTMEFRNENAHGLIRGLKG